LYQLRLADWIVRPAIDLLLLLLVSRWPSRMDRTVQLQYLISGNNRYVRVNLGRTTAAGALMTAKQLLQEGYIDVKICTPRGQILPSDEYGQLEG
jgi:hypothetical protein